MTQIQRLESQIKVFNSRLSEAPEKVDGKWNPSHFALKGKIKKLNAKLTQVKREEWLAQ